MQNYNWFHRKHQVHVDCVRLLDLLPSIPFPWIPAAVSRCRFPSLLCTPLTKLTVLVIATQGLIGLILYLVDESLDWLRIYRADSRFMPSQWETALHFNDVSYWLGASLELVLQINRFSFPVHVICCCLITSSAEGMHCTITCLSSHFKIRTLTTDNFN